MQDLNDYAFFAAVVNHGGFAAAARALNVPKSRISKHIAHLEERLGVRLIERTTRKFRVTELGEAFHARCEIVLAGAEEAEAVAAQARAEPQGLLRVACPINMVSPVMEQVLPPFMLAHPKVRVQLLVSNRRVDVIDERIDVALRVRTSLTSDPGLIVRQLGNSRLVLVASPGFATSHAGALTFEGIGRLPTLWIDGGDETAHWRLTNAEGENHDIRHRPVLASGDFNLLMRAAVRGLGVALLPEEQCAAAIEAGALVRLLPDWAATNGIVHLVFASKRGLLPAARALIDHLAREIPAVMRQCRETRR
ncbi:LysR family transcriptional regulator [Aestuariivirga sp.]|uniref:LysR family transcriptional regulator n=1 Tax=Aestuariivirga sp. TaxID=2650926 RepID=UPI0039E61DB9